jgi:hypothetical protein
MPLSVFVPDVTLIAFQFPQACARTVAEHFPHASSKSVRVKKMVSILMLRAVSGKNLNRPWLDIIAAAF